MTKDKVEIPGEHLPSEQKAEHLKKAFLLDHYSLLPLVIDACFKVSSHLAGMSNKSLS
jgi:hypothetical protein